jgi:hypothetical protein
MDYQSLVAAHAWAWRSRPPPSPDAEARYWRNQADLRRTGLRLVASAGAVAGVILMLVGVAPL